MAAIIATTAVTATPMSNILRRPMRSENQPEIGTMTKVMSNATLLEMSASLLEIPTVTVMKL